MSPPRKLPVLPLAHPVVLLPSSRLTFPVSRAVGEGLHILIADSEDDQTLVAAVPISVADADAKIPNAPMQWGTMARIVRLVRPPARNTRQSYLVSLEGLSRVRFTTSLDKDDIQDVLPPLRVEHPLEGPSPSGGTVDAFRRAALALLDRLSRDTPQQGRKETWTRVSNMVEGIGDDRAAWLADVIVSAVGGEYVDKLGNYPLFNCSVLIF